MPKAAIADCRALPINITAQYASGGIVQWAVKVKEYGGVFSCAQEKAPSELTPNSWTV
jgi:hypothetical protein